MNKNLILVELDVMLNEFYKNKENEYKHITYARKEVLKEAKAKGIIKDYYQIKTWNSKNLIWGSRVGYDNMYKIMLWKD